jgi:cytochrome c oxidase cbb3-type subunit 3
MAGTPEKDAISGQSTTGHEWDGIKELNTPLPKWWVYVFYVCILWAVAYWVAMPAWPLGNSFTKGMLGYNSRLNVDADIAEAKAAHATQLEAIAAKSVEEIAADADLRQYAMAGGEVLFKENCAPCHQSGGAGAVGFPTLADDEWLWGGDLASIQTTLIDGIRSENSDNTRMSEMPKFGEFLSPEEITQVATYVKDMSMGNVVEGPGQQLYVDNCAACHSSDYASAVSDGNHDMGAPSLGNNIWLYAGPGGDMTLDMIKSQIAQPRHGVMPAWGGRLKDEDIKMVTVYVHSLGGGQ